MFLRFRYLISIILLVVVTVYLTSCTDEKARESSVDQNEVSKQAKAINKSDKVFHRFQKAQIIDSSGFGRSVVAANMFIPTGWTTSGGIVWEINQNRCGKNGTRFEWSAISLDSRTVVEILPEETWSGNNSGIPQQGACPNLWLTTARDYLRAYVENYRSFATIRSYRDRTDINEEYKHLNQTNSQFGSEVRTWVGAGEVILDYAKDGSEYEEVLVLLIVFNSNRMPGVYQGEVREFLTMSMAPGFSMRAPKGQLNLKIAETIRKSAKPNPEWANLMAEHNMKMRGIAMKGAQDRHNIRMKSQREIADINQRSYDNQQKSRDRTNEKFNQMIRGVETYVDSSTNSTVELPYTHDNAWKLDDDTYVLTDDASFEPYRDLGISGSQLERSSN